MIYKVWIVFMALNFDHDDMAVCLDMPIYQQEMNECKAHYDSILGCKIYTVANIPPEFNGGKEKLFKFFRDKIRVSSQDIIDNNGRVLTEFVIDQDGTILGAKISQKKLQDYTILDRKILEIIYQMPKWRPARCGKINVSYLYKFPIAF